MMKVICLTLVALVVLSSVDGGKRGLSLEEKEYFPDENVRQHYRKDEFPNEKLKERFRKGDFSIDDLRQLLRKTDLSNEELAQLFKRGNRQSGK